MSNFAKRASSFFAVIAIMMSVVATFEIVSRGEFTNLDLAVLSLFAIILASGFHSLSDNK